MLFNPCHEFLAGCWKQIKSFGYRFCLISVTFFISKVERIFLMAISSESRIGQYRDDDHRKTYTTLYFLPIEKAIFWNMSDCQGRAAEFMNKSNFKKSSSVMNCVSYHCKVWCKFMCKWNIIIMFEIIDQWNWPNCKIKHQINNQWNQVLIKENCIPCWLCAFLWVLFERHNKNS